MYHNISAASNQYRFSMYRPGQFLLLVMNLQTMLKSTLHLLVNYETFDVSDSICPVPSICH